MYLFRRTSTAGPNAALCCWRTTLFDPSAPTRRSKPASGRGAGPAGPPPTTTIRMRSPFDGRATPKRGWRGGRLGVEAEVRSGQPPLAVSRQRHARLVERDAIPELARDLFVLLIEGLAVVGVRAP